MVSSSWSDPRAAIHLATRRYAIQRATRRGWRSDTMFPAVDMGWLPASGACAVWTNNVDATEARVVLGLVTRPVDITIRDTVQSLLELG